MGNSIILRDDVSGESEEIEFQSLPTQAMAIIWRAKRNGVITQNGLLSAIDAERLGYFLFAAAADARIHGMSDEQRAKQAEEDNFQRRWR